jgi:hypothetical protein
MATVTTTNTNTTPHVQQGMASNKVNIGGTNTLGVSQLSLTLPIPTPQPITYKANVNQVLGFVPLNFCNDTECRTYPEGEYLNLVVGNLTNTDYYYNDYSSFIISNTYYYQLNQPTAMYLQERTGGVWNTVATLTNNTYGYYIPYGVSSAHTAILGIGHNEYCGYIIDWRKVLLNLGEGIYRFTITVANAKRPLCGQSEPFCLQAYDCNVVLNTVKFEAKLFGGTIGDCNNPARLVDLCNVTYRDNIRFEGFFGFEKAEYDRKTVEYNNGIIYRVRDEEVKKFDLQTGRLPKWLHDRFKAYGLMADNLLVSDYNENNPDYNIKRTGVVCDSGYDPVYVQNSRFQRVKVSFKEDQQNLIRRRCCNGKDGAHG